MQAIAGPKKCCVQCLEAEGTILLETGLLPLQPPLLFEAVRNIMCYKIRPSDLLALARCTLYSAPMLILGLRQGYKQKDTRIYGSCTEDYSISSNDVKDNFHMGLRKS